jgi:D-proline reductase (dithiol) PrdB
MVVLPYIVKTPSGRLQAAFLHTPNVATLSDLSLKNRIFMAAYRYRRLDPVPFAVPRRPLSSARVALVSSGAVHLPEQTPFASDIKGGDFSFREIPGDVEVARLLVAHKSDAFDQTGFLEDRNLGFPLDRLREMAGRGEIGSLNTRHVSFMGSITAPGRLLSETAPAAANLLAADGVDVAILTPL